MNDEMDKEGLVGSSTENKISRRDALKRISKIGLGIGAAVVATSCDFYYSDYYYYYYSYSNYYYYYYYYYNN